MEIVIKIDKDLYKVYKNMYERGWASDAEKYLLKGTLLPKRAWQINRC